MTTTEHRGAAAVAEYLRNRPGARRALLIGGSIAVLLAIVLIALPVVAARVAEGWLRDHGADAATIGDIDFNPFSGALRVEALEAGDGPEARFSVALAELDVRWWPLVSRRVHVERLRLEGARIDVAVGDDVIELDAARAAA